MKAIILAGGIATRLPDTAKDRPKVLVDIAGKCILEHQLELLGRHKINDIRLALGFRADQVINHLKKLRTGRQLIDYVVETEPLGTGGAIKFASSDIPEDFLVINGDIITDLNLSDFINFHRDLKEKWNKDIYCLAAWKSKDCSDFGLIKHRRGKVLQFIEKPADCPGKSRQEGFINAGYYILNKRLFESQLTKVFSVERDIFPNAVKCGNLYAYLFEGLWLEAGNEQRLIAAKNKFDPLTKSPK